MSSFENCSPAELTVFARIADGGKVEGNDPEIVKRLVEMNLLDYFNDTDLTVPAIVWSKWERYKTENPQ